MIVTCPAAHSSFDFPPRRDSPNVAFYSPLHRSSPPPGCSSSLTFSASLSNLTFLLLTRAGHHRMKHNRRVVVVSFPVDSDEERDGDDYGESEGKLSGGGRNATQETARFARANFQGLEEPRARARVTWPFQDQARVSWSPQKQQVRASWSSKKHQIRDSWSSDNQHTAFGPSRNQHRDSFSSQNQHRASFSSQKQSRISWSPEEHRTRVYRPPVKQAMASLSSETQQHEGSFSSQKQPRVSSPSQYEPSRFHNNFSVFESVAEPDTFRRSSNNSADAPFFSAEETDISSKFNRQKPSYSRGLQSSFQNFQQEGSLGEGNPQKGSMFTSKLEEILSNFKEKDSFSKRSSFIDGLNDEGTRDDDAPLPLRNRSHTIRGLQGTISEGYTAQANGVSTPLRKDMQGARNTDFSLQTSVQDVNGKDVRENMQSHYEEGRFYPRSDAEDIGEGSFSANGKENAGGDHEAKTAPFNLFASSPPVPWEADRRYTSASKPRIPIGKGNAKMSVRCISLSIGSRSSPSQSSVLGRNSKYSKLDPQAGRGSTSALKLNGRAKQTEPWFKNKEGTEMCGLPELKEDEGTIQIKSRAQKSVESTETVNFDWIDSDTEDDAENVLSVPSDAEDDAATSCKSGTRSRHSKKSYQPALGTYSNHISSAISCVGVNTGASASSDGGDSSKTSSWHNHTLPGLPFEFQYSYSETPKAPILRYQEPPYSPFGPTTKERPWTGRAPLKQSKKKLPGFDSFNPPPTGKKGIKVQEPGPYPEGQGPKPSKSREEILGKPLTKEEIVYLVEKCQRESRQLNLGRDGLTHNMLDVIHCYWKRRRVCRVKCKGVPTVDMDNVCFHIEDKTGGKIIYKTGGVLYLFRGRNYNYKDRPKIPLMLWKPATPLYPKLIQQAPEGLTKEEADRLRLLGRKVKPICRLGKNGVYLTLVGDVRNAFKVDDLVRIDCRGLNPSDYKKIGAKLRDLVPCVLLSFDKEHILIWKGKAKASTDVDTKPSDEGVNLTETSASCNLGCSGLSIIENETKNLVDDASSHAAENELCFANEEFKQQSLVGDKIGWDKADLMPERTMAESKHDAAVDFTRGQESKSNAGLDSPSEAPSRSVKSNLVEEQYLDEEQYLIKEQYLDEEMEGEDTDFINSLLEEGRADHVVVRMEEQYLDEEMKGQDSNSINSLLDESRADNVVVHVDALWDHALASGMAIELDEADMDCDLVVRKAGELAQVAPIAPVYTQSLFSKLHLTSR